MTSVNLITGMVLLATLAAGCGSEGSRPAGEAAVERDALRTRTDAARGRLWVLRLDDVRVYDAASKRLIRKIELPGWSAAGPTCPPDLVLDRVGSAYVSSTVTSKLWRIDTSTIKAEEIRITLVDKEQWEVGFGALAFTPDGTLLAVTALAGTLWKLDVDSGGARMVGQGAHFLKVCELTEQFLSDFDRRMKP